MTARRSEMGVCPALKCVNTGTDQDMDRPAHFNNANIFTNKR